MIRLIYTVHAEFDDPALAHEFLNWLSDDHCAKVIGAGALSSEIAVLDRENDSRPFQVEVRYRFASRQAFDKYVKTHAECLRKEGLLLFGPDRGVRMSRTLSELRHQKHITDAADASAHEENAHKDR